MWFSGARASSSHKPNTTSNTRTICVYSTNSWHYNGRRITVRMYFHPIVLHFKLDLVIPSVSRIFSYFSFSIFIYQECWKLPGFIWNLFFYFTGITCLAYYSWYSGSLSSLAQKQQSCCVISIYVRKIITGGGDHF